MVLAVFCSVFYIGQAKISKKTLEAWKICKFHIEDRFSSKIHIRKPSSPRERKKERALVCLGAML